MKLLTKQKAIAEYCRDCASSAKEVTLCHLFSCPLWGYRAGYSINTTRYKERIKKAKINYVKDFGELKKMGVDIRLFDGL